MSLDLKSLNETRLNKYEFESEMSWQPLKRVWLVNNTDAVTYSKWTCLRACYLQSKSICNFKYYDLKSYSSRMTSNNTRLCPVSAGVHPRSN